eukprot:480812-Amphidinium_carterae.1
MALCPAYQKEECSSKHPGRCPNDPGKAHQCSKRLGLHAAMHCAAKQAPKPPGGKGKSKRSNWVRLMADRPVSPKGGMEAPSPADCEHSRARGTPTDEALDGNPSTSHQGLMCWEAPCVSTSLVKLGL